MTEATHNLLDEQQLDAWLDIQVLADRYRLASQLAQSLDGTTKLLDPVAPSGDFVKLTGNVLTSVSQFQLQASNQVSVPSEGPLLGSDWIEETGKVVLRYSQDENINGK